MANLPFTKPSSQTGSAGSNPARPRLADCSSSLALVIKFSRIYFYFQTSLCEERHNRLIESFRQNCSVLRFVSGLWALPTWDTSWSYEMDTNIFPVFPPRSTARTPPFHPYSMRCQLLKYGRAEMFCKAVLKHPCSLIHPSALVCSAPDDYERQS